MKNLTYFIVIGITLSSCSYHIGTIGGGTGSITNNEFRTIDFAYGTSKTANILGIGGNKKDALVLEAKRNLYQNYGLKPNQVIGQTSVDIKRTVFFPVLTTKVTISAEIIDFSDDTIDTTQNQENKNQFINPKNDGLFNLGNKVYYSKGQKTFSATVLGYVNDKYVIKYIDHNNNFKIKRVTYRVLKSQKQTTQDTN